MYELHHISHGKVAAAATWTEFLVEIKNTPYPKPNIEKMEEYIKSGSAFSYAVNTLTAFRIVNDAN